MARPIRVVSLGAEAVSASTPYVLVDLSNSGGGFKHAATAVELHLLGLILHTEKASDGAYDVWVGVVTENDATDGSATWCHVFHIEATGNPTDSADRFAQAVDFTLGGANSEGINLAVVSGALPFYVSNQTQADNTNWQNDTNRTSPAGNVMPGVGDLVMWVEEASGTGTIDFHITAVYYAA